MDDVSRYEDQCECLIGAITVCMNIRYICSSACCLYLCFMLFDDTFYRVLMTIQSVTGLDWKHFLTGIEKTGNIKKYLKNVV